MKNLDKGNKTINDENIKKIVNSGKQTHHLKRYENCQGKNESACLVIIIVDDEPYLN